MKKMTRVRPSQDLLVLVLDLILSFNCTRGAHAQLKEVKVSKHGEEVEAIDLQEDRSGCRRKCTRGIYQQR